MNNSKWEQFALEDRIIAVLSDSKYDTVHNFERPFLTPYQIGIKLVSCHPTICDDVDMEFGGKGTGLRNSFIQYIANQLSDRIGDGRITRIQGAFLANDYLHELSYLSPNGSIVESSKQSPEYLSMFRLNPGD